MNKQDRGLNALTLHLLGMAFMLCDHLWATVVPGQNYLTWIGRLTFPIFAFLIAEGYAHTSDVKKYQKRMLIFALIAEIPFNLMYFASWIFPFHQNVLWTFLIALAALRTLDELRARRQGLLRYALMALSVFGFFLLGKLTMVDYGGEGVLMVLVFYFFRGSAWWQRAAQLACLYYINFHMISGLNIPLTLGGFSFEFPQQGFAIFALPLLWLYNGRQGPHSKPIQYLCYAFYPVHMLILGLLSM